MSDLVTISILSTMVYGAVNYLKAPIVKQWPDASPYFIYVQFAAAFVIVFASGFNVLGAISDNAFLGRTLTAIAAGGGSEMIYSLQRLLSAGWSPIVTEIIEQDGGELLSMTAESRAKGSPLPDMDESLYVRGLPPRNL